MIYFNLVLCKFYDCLIMTIYFITFVPFMKQQINILMQIKPTSTKVFPTQQQYNFKVKVDYQNGSVTVQGPNNQFSKPIHNYPQSQPQPNKIPLTLTHPLIYQHPYQPQLCPQTPIQTQYRQQPQNVPAYPLPHQFPVFQSPVAPPRQPMILIKANSEKMTAESALSSSGSMRTTKDFATLHGKTTLSQLTIQKPAQQQIDCVLCQKKFKQQDFQYHLQLHRNPRRKTQSVEVIHKDIPTKQIQRSQMSMKDLQNHNNSFQSQRKPEMLYSFHKQSSIFQNSPRPQESPQIYSVHSSSQQLNQSVTFNSLIQNQNSSKISETKKQAIKQQIQHSVNSYDSQQSYHSFSQPSNTNKSNDKKSGIRYIGYQNDANGSLAANGFHGIPLKQSFGVNTSLLSSQNVPNNLNGSISSSHPASVHNSRILLLDQSRQSSRNLHPQTHYISQQNLPPVFPVFRPDQPASVVSQPAMQIEEKKQSSLNPFKQIIQQQQSQIYDYFPHSQPHQQLHPSFPHSSNGANKQILNFKETNRSFVTQNVEDRKRLDRIQCDRNKRNAFADEGQKDLQMSRSSISSIKSLKTPLEDMSRDRILKHYHTNKNRIDLSNIIGLSDALAKQGYSNSQSKSFRNSQSIYSQLQRRSPQTSLTNLKLVTAKSMYLPEAQLSQPQNLPQMELQQESKIASMKSIQNRQIYRGTQVEQNELQAMDSLLNMTRSSKISAKSKLPRNYLAVNQFINSQFSH